MNSTQSTNQPEQQKQQQQQQQNKPKKKICCACPDTKAQRDDCVVQNGPENCQKYIEAHKQCLREEGFNV